MLQEQKRFIQLLFDIYVLEGILGLFGGTPKARNYPL